MSDRWEPLTESYYYILLCLYEGPNHGYGIMQRTLELSGGRVRIGSGTMYGAAGNMIRKGWIAERPPEGGGFSRKREYQLTERGRDVLRQEIGRLNHLVRAAETVTGGNAS